MGKLGMKMLKCLLTDSGVLLLFIVNTIKNRFPEVPAAMCAVLTSLFLMYTFKINISLQYSGRQKLFIFPFIFC